MSKYPFAVSLHRLNRKETIETVLRRMARNEQTAIFTPNPIMLERAAKDESFRRVLARGDLRVADGVGVCLAARIAGIPSIPRTAGIELAESLLAVAARTGLRVFLLGGKPGVAERAAQALRARFPSLTVCGTHHGYFSEEESDALCRAIERTRAHVVLVCLGSPRQEIWIDRHRRQLPSVKLLMGLGGSLDVWAGNVRRAPRPLRKIGLEWAWRMALEPHRLKGLIPLSAFLARTVKWRLIN